MASESGSARPPQKGFVIGELLMAVLLLAVAVSSLAALMYSVSHRSDVREATSCVTKSESPTVKCGTTAGGGAKVLRSACTGKTALTGKGCVDSAVYRTESGAVIVRSKTDSASLAIVAKKPKSTRDAPRPDRGFIR